MDEDNMVVEEQQDGTPEFIKQITDLNEQLRILRSDNKMLTETIVRMAMRDVGVLK